jgi:DNA polymerase-3 subunit epsilon
MADQPVEKTAEDLPPWTPGPLERPLAALDLETTGTQPHLDRIVEIAVIKILPDGRSETRSRRVNPGMPIPPEATRVHGIRDLDVAGEPPFNQIAASLAEFLAGCDLVGFNLVKFDLPLLRREFERAGMELSLAGRRVIDAKTIYHLKEPRHLSAAHQFYCGKALVDAHTAEADARAAYNVLVGQLQRYPDLPRSLDALHRLCNPVDVVDADGKLVWQGDDAVFNFGKMRGRALRVVLAVDRNYLQYLVDGDFPADFKRILAAALQGRLPQRDPSAISGIVDDKKDPVQTHLPFPWSRP